MLFYREICFVAIYALFVWRKIVAKNVEKKLQIWCMHPNTPQTPHRHPPVNPVNTKYQQTTTGTNRHRQTNSNGTGRCPRVSGGVCWHLLSSNGILSSLEMSGGVWWMSGGFWGYLVHGNLRRWALFWGYLGSQSLQNGAKTLPWRSSEWHDFCSSEHTETSSYQNVHI